MVLTAYFVLVVMFSALQRSLIYFPTQEGPIKPEDAELPPGQVHTITLHADDDVELHGWHILPDGRSAANRAECDHELALGRRLVLYFSGNAGNRQYRVDEFRIFTGLGLDVFLFDYRGYGDNSGSPNEESLAADARAVWRYAIQERNVAPERIILYGESLGGGVAVRLAAEMCEAGTPPAGLVVRSTFSSLVDVGAFHYPWLPVRLALNERYPSTERIAQVSCPFLQIHGGKDTIIPIELGRRLFEAAPDASSSGLNKEFVDIPTADHNDLIFVGETEFRSAIHEFLNQL